MQTQSEFDLPSLFSQQIFRKSWAQLNCCELFNANLWRQHLHPPSQEVWTGLYFVCNPTHPSPATCSYLNFVNFLFTPKQPWGQACDVLSCACQFTHTAFRFWWICEGLLPKGFNFCLVPFPISCISSDELACIHVYVQSSRYIHEMTRWWAWMVSAYNSKFIKLSFLVTDLRRVPQKQYIYFNKVKKFMKLAIYPLYENMYEFIRRK